MEGLTDRTTWNCWWTARVGLFTVKPPQATIITPWIWICTRVRVTAGPHIVAAAFPKKPSLLLETEEPYQAHFSNDRHPRSRRRFIR